MQLVPMGAPDVVTVADLAQRSFVATYSEFNTQENMDKHLEEELSESVFSSLLSNDPKKGLVYLANDDTFHAKKPVGFFQLVAGDWKKGARSAIEILRFYLDPKAIGGGYGRKMMQSCFELSKKLGYNQIWLGVWDQNQNAIGFYQRLGFKKVGEKSFFLGADRQSDWVMERHLSSY